MKYNKHPHHDLIVEWAKDTNKQPQMSLMIGEPRFCSCSIADVISNPTKKVRFKPREFTKGHWYPCVFNASNSSENGKVVMMFNGESFKSSHNSMLKWDERYFSWIGESLGEIEFGGEQ